MQPLIPHNEIFKEEFSKPQSVSGGKNEFIAIFRRYFRVFHFVPLRYALLRHSGSGQVFWQIFIIKITGRSLKQEKQNICPLKDLSCPILIKIGTLLILGLSTWWWTKNEKEWFRISHRLLKSNFRGLSMKSAFIVKLYPPSLVRCYNVIVDNDMSGEDFK